MKTFAINGPDGKTMGLGLDEESAWASSKIPRLLIGKFISDGYRCVPVQITEGWIPVGERLPEVKHLTSETVLWAFDGKVYSGHLHENGWFYCDERNSHKKPMAMARRGATPFGHRETPNNYATHWQPLPPPPKEGKA